MFYVYILECSDNSLYTGKTIDLVKRLKSHNGVLAGGAKYTNGRRPVYLVYYEEFDTITSALKREFAIKKLKKEEKINLIRSQ